MELLGWIGKKLYKRHVKKMRKERLSERDKKRQETVEKLRELIKFIRELDEKGFKNRTERKQFWRDVRKGKPRLQNTLLQVVDRLSGVDKKEKESKNDKMNIKDKAEVKTIKQKN